MSRSAAGYFVHEVTLGGRVKRERVVASRARIGDAGAVTDPRKPPAPARPASPNAPKPPVPGGAGSPRPPQVGAPVGTSRVRGKMPSSPGYATPKKENDLPSDSAWDTADTVTSIPDVPPAAPTPTPTPSPAAMTRGAKSVPPPAASTSPGPSVHGLNAPMREEVWAIVRAAISEATQPMIAKQRELEERLARAEQAARSRPPPAFPAGPPAGASNSIPVMLGPSLAPPGAPAGAAPDSATNPNFRAPQKSIRLSVPPGVYGVAVVDPGPQKPAVDLANVGPIHDMPDFGSGRTKTVGRIIAGIMVLVLAAAIIATIASRS